MQMLAKVAALMMAVLPASLLAQPVTIPVTAAPGIGSALSGRLIVFAKKIEPGAKPDREIDTSPFHPTDTAIAAREVSTLRQGEVALVDGETDAFPRSFSKLALGTYRFQAVLDRNHDYNYGGRGEGDLVSAVVEAKLPGPGPQLVLSEALPAVTLDEMLARAPEKERAGLRAALDKTQAVDLVSPALSAFWGRAIHIRGWVALPPGYGTDSRTYPTVYSTGGFGSTLASARGSAAGAIRRMAAGEMPPMIWVYLDESSATGTHEFADSVNNGPWGQALTTEFIPWIEGRYAMDGRANSRFLTGHSSGGWATLWLQTRYPKVFGGTWSTSPDPSDFHDFTNIDIYAPNANAYVGDDGNARPLVRDKGKVLATFRQFGEMEQVLGGYGGQFASFEWVFSPRGPDGRPLPLFDRATGRVDPEVAAYWRENYDIAYRMQRDWPMLKSDLDGKIHLIVGTADTFYLDGPAHRLKAVLDGLGAKSSFTFIAGKTHGDLFVRGDDRQALMKDIAWQMYAIARPGIERPMAR
jgi:hypothetical protein